ncbi:vegetative cell wall hydrolase [Sporosarcina newyorkensis 2681]|uniref:Vegetative cell wall hydrolase n=1 Tax=Sporosarcina newyorkensis 2681 TaxID=1027292 RepID=F9DQE8_9BACL|nr:C40 family peptidase [Sporosarcina newyorkensis]EGQ26998.1 vegetative cell wall hydrolase [Sporosarcina newyorkensis 2681]
MKKTALAAIASLMLATSISVGSADASTKTYVVKPGDSLWKVANQYKLTVNELKSLNALSSDTIKVNQKLIVENKSKNTKTVSSTNSLHDAKKPIVDKPTVTPKPSAGSSALMNKVVDVAMPLQGVPYVWAGATPSGFDCSGFIYYVFNQAGVKVPRLDTIGMYDRSVFIKTPIVGDLLFFENTYRAGISHIGIYLGDSKFIHAGTNGIEIASVKSPYWNQRFLGYKRFKDIK